MTLTTPATARKPRRKASRNPLLPTADDIRTGFRLDHQFSNARIEDLESAAAEADLAHDVAQAASNPDVIAALDADTLAIFNSMPTMPDPIFYSRRGHGFTWGDHPNAYPSYTDAANARDGR